MTTNYIDTSLHASSFPATYIVPGFLANLGVSITTTPAAAGLLIGNCVQSDDSDVIAGYFTAAGNATILPVGFAPSRVTITDWTGGFEWVWMLGAPATDTVKKTFSGPTITVDTTSAIVITADAAGGVGNSDYITLSSGLCANNHVLSFRIEE